VTEELDDLTPFERVLRSARRPAKILDMPGYPGAKVAMLVPSDEEIAEAQAATLQYLTGPLKLDEFKLAVSLERNLFEAEEARQILVRVLRNPVQQELPFATIESLRRGLNKDMRNVLMRTLAAWVEERSPEKKDDGDGERLVGILRDLKAEGALPDYLMSCGFATLTSFVLALADQFLPPTERPSSDTGT